MIDLPSVLVRLRPNEKWTIQGEPVYSNLVWLDSTPKPTEQEIQDSYAQIDTTVGWEKVRAERNRRLTASDWAMLPDAKVSKPYWENYRQALRDIPQRYATPDEVQWPQEPS